MHPMLQASIFRGGAPNFFRKGAILWANNCEKMTMYGKKKSATNLENGIVDEV